MSEVQEAKPEDLTKAMDAIRRIVMSNLPSDHAAMLRKNKKLEAQRDSWRNKANYFRSRLVERGDGQDSGGWMTISTAPTSEDISFVALVPMGDHQDGSVEVQVTRFEGSLYPDIKGENIDRADAITNATHWRRRYPAPS